MLGARFGELVLMADTGETSAGPAKFDFASYPSDTCFHERRSGRDRRDDKAAAEKPKIDRRERKERRRRVDPTTFEKQYTCDEVEFMTAMQYFKVQTGKTFPSYREVLQVARKLGYVKLGPAD